MGGVVIGILNPRSALAEGCFDRNLGMSLRDEEVVEFLRSFEDELRRALGRLEPLLSSRKYLEVVSAVVAQAFVATLKADEEDAVYILVRCPLARIRNLTKRQREVAALASEDLHNDDIAAYTELSPATVADYVRQVYPKLGIRSREGLGRYALGLRYLEREREKESTGSARLWSPLLTLASSAPSLNPRHLLRNAGRKRLDP
jgi:DNA-binding CsgD family transcriptional regulator